MKKGKKRKIAAGILLLILVAMLSGSALYVNDYYHAEEFVTECITHPQGNVTVKEEKQKQIAFVPREPVAGLIFYPGGKVQYEAYAPLMEACAQRGILCVLVHMPGNLAVLDQNAADGIREQFPQIDRWYVGGHSLGGAMAASYAGKHADEFEGLVLLAAYATADLHETTLNVLSVYGSEDGVLNREKYQENRENLPTGFTELVIEGGCHAYFGSYGAQDGDGTPTISNQEQITQTADAIKERIEKK